MGALFPLKNANEKILVVDDDQAIRWTLSEAYNGTVKTTVKADSNGDVHLFVTDSNGTHEFLVKDGGLGPIYAKGWVYGQRDDYPRSDNYPPAPSAAGVWYKNYRSAVTNRSAMSELFCHIHCSSIYLRPRQAFSKSVRVHVVVDECVRGGIRLLVGALL